MPAHDWTRVDDGIFHDFHQAWIIAIKTALNGGVLPANFYALAEQRSGRFEPDVITLQSDPPGDAPYAGNGAAPAGGGGLMLAPPPARPTAEVDAEFFQRKQNAVVVRHTSGDAVVAVIEVVSPGNKSSAGRFRAFVQKAGDLLARYVHLVVVDLHPPGPRDPHGVHAAVWEDVAGGPYQPPAGKPLAAAAYEAASDAVRAYVEPFAVGDAVPATPLFLVPNGCVMLDLDATYRTAFAGLPRRWRAVLEA